MNDRYFMALAVAAGAASKDQSRKVGCVIVGPDNDVRATGFNGFPRRVDDDVPERNARTNKYLWTEHAERNAIYNAARIGVPLAGCRIYIPWYPCMDCARAIIQVGIVEMITCEPDLNDPQWGTHFVRVAEMLREGGVKVTFFTP